MSNVRTHIEVIFRSVTNSSRRRRVVSLSLLLFCLAAGVRLVSIEAAAFEPKGALVPNPPSGLIVSVVSSSSLRLQWQDNSSNETSFSVFRCQGNSCTPFSSIGSVGADTAIFTNTSLSGGTTYGYYVCAVGKGGRTSAPSNTAWSTTLAASPTPTPTPTPNPTPMPTPTPTATPTAPANLTATPVSTSQINLTWTDMSGNESGFKIQRLANSVWTQVGTTAANVASWANGGLSASTTYTYRVMAYNATGDSPASNQASATTQTLSGPSAPAASGATSLTSSSFTANWSSVSGASGYQLDVASNSAFSSYVSGYQSLNVGNVVSRSVSGLSASTTYYYRVRAFDTNGTSGNSNIVTVTTSAAADTTAPTVPSSLTATAASASQINLSWSAATDSGGSGLAGYRVYQSGTHTGTTAATSYAQTGLSANVQYCFTVAAYDNAGNVSGQSVQACATTQSISAGSGSHVWSRNFGGAFPTDTVTVTSTGVDSSGNIIVTGYFQGNVDFGGGAVSSIGGQDIFVAQYSSTGAYLWSKTMGSVADDYATALCVDRSNNIIVTGSFNYSVDFGGGALNSASPGLSDIFLVKYSAAGVHQWSRQFGDTGNDTGYGVTADASGNVVVTGSFVGSADFGGGRLTSNLNSNDIFIAKYSSTGGHSWSRAYGSTGDDHGTAAATDGSGNVVVTGYFNNTIDFAGGPLTSAGNKEIFLLALNSSGQHVWSKRLGGISIDVANAVAIDVGGNIIITGFFYGTVDFGGGPLTSSSAAKVFLAKYNSQGNHSWSKVFSGSVVTDNAISLRLAVDGNSNILFTGYFNGSANFGGQTFTSAGSDDVFAAKYSAAGTHSWSQRFGGPGLDQGKAIVADAGNNMILSGYFNYAVSFGGPTLSNLNGSDFYLVKLTP